MIIDLALTYIRILVFIGWTMVNVGPILLMLVPLCPYQSHSFSGSPPLLNFVENLDFSLFFYVS